jgi:acyl-CoA thioesterase
MRTGTDAAPTERWAGFQRPTAADLAAGRPCHVPVDRLICAAGDVAFGGFSMALIAEAAAGWTGGRVRSLSANFLAPIMLGESLSLKARPLRIGRRVRQLGVEAQVGERPVISAAVALGGPPPGGPGLGGGASLDDPVRRVVRVSQPRSPVAAVPPPGRCPQRSYRFRKPGSLIDVIDARLASPEPGPGASVGAAVLLWARLDAALSDEATLIALSDHLPYLVVRALPGVRHATTVSASVRLSAAPATEWTLLDIRLLDVDGEFCNGRVRLWSQAGELVATAGQTTYLVLAD